MVTLVALIVAVVALCINLALTVYIRHQRARRIAEQMRAIMEQIDWIEKNRTCVREAIRARGAAWRHGRRS